MLTKIEKRILESLEAQPMHASEMAIKLGIPRTSVAYNAKNLLKAGLLKEKKNGRKVLYALQNKRGKSSVSEIYEGNTFYEAYAHLLSLPRHTTLYGVQGAEAGKPSLEKTPTSLLKDVHTYFKRNGLIMKTVSNTQLLDSIKIDQELKESHKGRTLGARFTRDSLFLMGAELYSAPKLLIIVNPVDQRAFATRDPNMCELVYQICSIVYESFGELPSTNMDQWLDSKS